MKNQILLLGILAGFLGVTSCGDNGSSSSEQMYAMQASSIAQSQNAQLAAQSSVVTQVQTVTAIQTATVTSNSTVTVTRTSTSTTRE